MSDETSPALKEMFDAARYEQIANLIKDIQPKFDRQRFLDLTIPGLDQLSLLQRMRRTSEACRETLPLDFPRAVAILKRLAPRLNHGFVGIFIPDFVGLYGHVHFRESMDALKFLTPFGSSEFAVREFLKRDLTGTLKVMTEWSRDPDAHVRRLASEGSRPRLPWSFRLDALIKNPELTQPILNNLKADPSPYVRKSVANHLNDVSKDHPDLMLEWLSCWNLENPDTAWIARHAARSLIKQGHPRSFRLFGFTAKPEIKIKGFAVTPARLAIGETLTFVFTLISTAAKPQKLAVDYVIHYRKKAGQLAPKVFKLKEIMLAPHGALSLKKRQRLMQFTTRVHYAGRHLVEIMVNGKIIARREFDLA